MDIKELRKVSVDCYWPTSLVSITEILDRLEALEKERNTLRTKIEAMEKQEPVGIQHRVPFVNSNGECVGYTTWKDGRGFDHWPHRSLYLAPGAKGEENE